MQASSVLGAHSEIRLEGRGFYFLSLSTELSQIRNIFFTFLFLFLSFLSYEDIFPPEIWRVREKLGRSIPSPPPWIRSAVDTGQIILFLPH